MVAAAQLCGSAAAPARRWPAPSNGLLRSSPPLASSRALASLRRRPSYVLESASKPSISMCVKANSSEIPADPSIAVEYTDDQIQEPVSVGPTSENAEKAASQQKSAKIHDFCLGIPFGAFLFSMGLVGFVFWRSPVSLTFGVAPGLAILALGVLSLKVWRSGKSSLPFILAQAGVAAAVAWKHCQAYTATKKLLPWGFYALLSAAMICFYLYVLLAGGNPPPKKKLAAAS